MPYIIIYIIPLLALLGLLPYLNHCPATLFTSICRSLESIGNQFMHRMYYIFIGIYDDHDKKLTRNSTHVQ